MNSQIGILGYGGKIGKIATEILLKKNFRIIGGQRYPSPIFEKYQNFSAVCMDLTDPASLNAFCQNCDIIINCTSPSSLYASLIAETTARQKKLYIDPSDLSGFDTDPWPESRFLVSCGYMPGMSEYLVKWLCETYFDSIEQIQVYQGGTELCSPAAFADIILSAETSGCGDVCLSGGEIRPLKTDISKQYSLPFLDRPVMMKSFLSYDMMHVCQQFDAETVCSFNLYPDPDLLDLYFKAIFAAVESGADRMQAAEKIKSLVKAYPKQLDCFSILAAEVSGIQNGKTKIMRSMIHTPDSAEICGFFLAECTAAACIHDFTGKQQGFQLLDLSFMNAISAKLKKSYFLTQEITAFGFAL